MEAVPVILGVPALSLYERGSDGRKHQQYRGHEGGSSIHSFGIEPVSDRGRYRGRHKGGDEGDHVGAEIPPEKGDRRP
jgi:hypothetical protein